MKMKLKMYKIIVSAVDYRFEAEMIKAVAFGFEIVCEYAIFRKIINITVTNFQCSLMPKLPHNSSIESMPIT